MLLYKPPFDVSEIILLPKALKVTPVYSTWNATAAAGEMHFLSIFFLFKKETATEIEDFAPE